MKITINISLDPTGKKAPIVEIQDDREQMSVLPLEDWIDLPHKKPRKMGDYRKKINRTTALLIRKQARAGRFTNVELGKRFGLSPHTVSLIKHNWIWCE